MKKHLIVSGILFILLMVVLGGCNDLQSDNQPEIDIKGKIDENNIPRLLYYGLYLIPILLQLDNKDVTIHNKSY